MSDFIPVNEPLLDGNEKKYLAECIDTGWISSEGPFVKRFEEEFAARMGGEEFVLFYPTVNRTAALELAEELRMKVLGLKIPHEKSLTAEYVTVSIGVISCVPEWELEFDTLLKAADDALSQ